MRSIRQTLTGSLLGGLAAVFLFFAALAFFTARYALIKHFDEALLAKAEGLVSAAEWDDDGVEIDLRLEGFASFGSENPLDYFELLGEDGTSYQRSPALGEARLAPGPFSPQELPQFQRTSLPDATPGRLVTLWFRPIDDDTELPGERVCLVVASSSRGLDEAIGLLAVILFVGTVLGLGLAVPITLISLRLGLRPVTRLADEAAELRADSLSHRFAPAALPLELQPVAEKLNELLASLEFAFERERRFSSDVSHELRAPIAELRAIAEVALRWPEQVSPDAFSDVRAISLEMEALVQHLTQLARIDAGAQTVETVPFEFSGAIQDVIDRETERSPELKTRSIVSLRPGRWNSDPVLWAVIARNLIENAIRYAPSGAAIEIEAEPGSLVVRNRAPRLQSEDLPNLGKSFWRKDESRTGYGHSGLGLALVKAHAGLLGASFTACLIPGTDVLEIVVQEPAKPAASPAVAPGDEAAPGAAPSEREKDSPAGGWDAAVLESGEARPRRCELTTRDN